LSNLLAVDLGQRCNH